MIRSLLLCILMAFSSTCFGGRGLLLCVETNTAGQPIDYHHYWAPSLTGLNDNGPGGYLSVLRNTATRSSGGYNLTSDTAYVQLPARFTNGLNYSVMAWVYPNLTKMNANASGGWIISDRDSSGNGKLDLQLFYSKSSGTFGFGAGQTNSSTLFSVLSAAITNEKWYQLSAVVSVTNIKLYVDGVLVGSTNSTANVSDGSTVAMRIGEASWTAVPGGTSSKWFGYIDLVRMYKRALSAQEILAVYTYEKTRSGR